MTISIVIAQMFLICHVTSRKHIFEGLCELMRRIPPVIHHLTMFGGHWSSASGDMKYLKFHITSPNDVIEGSSNFMSGSSSRNVTTLTSLVVSSRDVF